MMKEIYLSLGNNLILSGLIFGFTILTGPSYTRATPPSGQNQEEIRKIESKLSREREQLNVLGSREKDILVELARLEQEVAEKRGAINELNLKIRHARTEVDVLKGNLLHLEQLSMEAQNKISKKLVEFYKHARIGYVKALTDVTDITDFLRRVKYFSVVMAQDRTALLRAAEQAHAQQNEISKTEARLNEIKDANMKEEARLKSLKKELEEKVLLLVNIHQEKKFYETAVQELETAAEGLKQTLIDIEKKDIYETNRSCHFEDFKGKLPYPMNGKVLKGHELPQSAGLGTHKGIIIEGSPSSEVTAIFPGRVAFSGGVKGYGELVIINHGSRFFSVSANLSARNKFEGEVVKEGEVVGQVVANGVSGGRLYFEIRRAGKGLNPQEWLKPQ
ncbi:MAG: peptidoglycan DD-metalloendopeptidase family protein [Candidatus Desulfacyla sp.]